MKAIHQISHQNLAKTVSQGAGLLTTDGSGGYLWLSQKNLASRYQGWFVNLGGRMYKIIDQITLVEGKPEIDKFKNIWLSDPKTRKGKTNYLQRIKGDLSETFFLSQEEGVLVYETSSRSTFEIFLDVRRAYDLPKWGRSYNVYEKNDFLIIKYENSETAEIIFIAISLKDIDNYETIKEWIEKSCPFDQRRKSPPYNTHIYKILRLKGKRIFIGVGFCEKEAIDRARNSIKTINIKSAKDKIVVKTKTTSKKDNLRTVGSLAQESFLSLLVEDDNKNLGIYAGLPWFFQFWSRDEAVSLKALFKLKQDMAINLGSMLFSEERIGKNGRIPNLREGFYPGSPSESADAVGWTLFRWKNLLFAETKTKKRILFKELVEKTIQLLIKEQTNKKGLAVNGPLETWMDTEFCGDNRSGARIEIQALRLSMYAFAYQITGKNEYKSREQELLKKVRNLFWNGKFLEDGLNDNTIRPNIFLAYYIYPKILNKHDWEICFNYALKSLWLPWGGLASIDKNDSLFMGEHSGENPVSYHRGDSWFWINNIAAISMISLNISKFSEKIDKILKASIKDFLWCTAIGHSSEISSASKFEPTGSISQAWSVSTLIELLDKINKIDLLTKNQYRKGLEDIRGEVGER